MFDFYIQQQSLSSNSRTIVKDEKGTPLFLLVGRWGTRGDALSLYQMNGNIVASIKQTSFALGSKFDLYKAFEKVGTLQRALSFNRDFYFVHGLNWVVIGDIKNQQYGIYQLNHKLMDMEKTSLSTGDFYHLSVKNQEDAPICICISAILDYWLLNRRPQKERKFELIWTIE